MGKRTDFPKVERDFYPTPYEAAYPLLPFLPRGTKFYDPCAGADDLVQHLRSMGLVCTDASDTQPRSPHVREQDVLTVTASGADYFITHPPWTWQILDPIIVPLSSLLPTWLLLNADLMHNRRMADHMRRCKAIVSIGRVSWMNNGKKGYENSAWYLFDQLHRGRTSFYARTKEDR